MKIRSNTEIDFLIRNDVAHILVPKVIECMIIQMKNWEIALEVGLSCGPTFGQQYEFDYHKGEDGHYIVDGPALEPEKKKTTEEVVKEKEEEEIRIEF